VSQKVPRKPGKKVKKSKARCRMKNLQWSLTVAGERLSPKKLMLRAVAVSKSKRRRRNQLARLAVSVQRRRTLASGMNTVSCAKTVAM
jgi:hypothetical protein